MAQQRTSGHADRYGAAMPPNPKLHRLRRRRFGQAVSSVGMVYILDWGDGTLFCRTTFGPFFSRQALSNGLK